MSESDITGKDRERFPYSASEISEIMVTGSPDQRAMLQQLLEPTGINKEQFELSVAAQKLRCKVKQQQQEAVDRRVRENPVASQEELSLGCLFEEIEPHVLDAVLLFRAKGYNTVSSGFSDFNSQDISFAENYFSDCDPKIRTQLGALGVKVRDHRLLFECTEIDLQKIKATWDAIAAILPDRGSPSPDTPSKYTGLSRKRFDETGRLKPEWIKWYFSDI